MRVNSPFRKSVLIFISLVAFLVCGFFSVLKLTNKKDVVQAEAPLVGAADVLVAKPDQGKAVEQSFGGKSVFFYVTNGNGEEKLVGNGEVVMIEKGKSLAVCFALQKGFYGSLESIANVSMISPTIKINNSIVSGLNNGISEPVDTSIDYVRQEFKKVINYDDLGKAGGDIVEGKVDFSFSYYLHTGSEVLQNTIDFSFYMFRADTYNNSLKRPNITFSNTTKAQVNSGRTFNEYFYNYNNFVDTKTVLPNLTYNINNFEIKVIRTFQGRAHTYRFEKVGDKVVVSSSNPDSPALKVEMQGGAFALITFNDLGVYTIEYNYIYYIGDTKIDIEIEEPVSNKNDILNIFGYQAVYSDVESGSLKEFKNDTESADISAFVAVNGLTGNKIQNKGAVSTNQAPVSFLFNAENFESKYMTYDATPATSGWKEDGAYNNESLKTSGDYFIKVKYKFPAYKEMSGTEIILKPDMVFCQYFYFKIKTDVPKAEVETVNPNGQAAEKMFSDTFTNKSIKVKLPKLSAFDSKVKVVVERADFNNLNTFTNEVVLTADTVFENNYKYRVSMKYGKGFAKQIVGYYTVDKQQISGIKAQNIEISEYSNLFIKGKDVTMFDFVNKAFALEWNYKPSGANIFATYNLVNVKKENTKKIMPIANQFAETWISSSYFIDYSKAAVLSDVAYQNTINKNVVSGTDILNEEGLYLFKFVDEAGNSGEFFIMIDKTAPVFLQKRNVGGTETYFEPSKLNYVSDDTIVEWGTHKVFRIGGIANEDIVALGNGTSTMADSSFGKFLLKKANLISSSTTDVYLKNGIKQVALSTDADGIKKLFGKTEEIRILDNQGNVVEQRYVFLAVDSANIDLGEDSIIDANSISKCSAIHEITTTTDLAASVLSLDSACTTPLKQYGGSVTKKPNAKEIVNLKNYKVTSNDIIYFAYIKNPDPNISVISVTCDFYALKFDSVKKTYFYSKEKTSLSGGDFFFRPLVIDGKSFIVAAINPTDNGKTMPGKYVITRKYNPESEVYITNKNDFMTREFVFFVDRNPLITVPSFEDVSGAQEQMMRVGEFWEMNVLATDGLNRVKFDAFYRQNQGNINKNDPSTINQILITNKLPLQILVPFYKYGTVTNGVFSADSVGADITTGFNVNEIKNLHPDACLSAYVTYNGNKTHYSTVGATGFIDIPMMRSDGIYYVEIKDGSGASWIYSFEIRSYPPEISLYAISQKGSGHEQTSSIADSVSFSNADNIKVGFCDPLDEFEARINREELYYEVVSKTGKGIAKRKVLPSEIVKDGNMSYFYVDKSYVLKNSDVISVFAQYEGKEADYKVGTFSVVRQITIDYMAPVANLNNLFDGVLISSVAEITASRISGDKFNKTSNLGLYPHITYAMPKDFSFAIAQNSIDTAQIFWREFADKYGSGYYETSIPTDPQASVANMFDESTWNLLDNLKFFDAVNGKSGIYEICEKDSAGNFTIYSVKLFNDTLEIKVGFESVAGGTTEKLIMDNGEISVYESFSLNNISINSQDWWNLTILENGSANAFSFRKNPFSGSGVFIGATNTNVPLKGAFKFENNKKYKLTLTDRVNKKISTFYVNVSSANRKFNVEWTASGKDLGIKIYKDPSSILKAISFNAYSGTITNSAYIYEEIEFSDLGQNPVYYFCNWKNVDFSKIIKLKIVTNFNSDLNYYYAANSPNIENQWTGEDLYDGDAAFDIISSHNVSFHINKMLYTYSIKEGNRFVSESVKDGVLSVTLRAAGFEYFDGNKDNPYIGEKREWTVSIKSLIDSNDVSTFKIKIDNVMPKVNLFDDYGADRNGLFNGLSITKQPVVVRFVDSDSKTFKVTLKKKGAAGDEQVIASGKRISEAGTYVISVSLVNGFTATYSKQFTISSESLDIFSVIGKTSLDSEESFVIEKSAIPYAYLGKNLSHYISNYPILSVITDSSLKLFVSSTNLSSSDGTITKLYNISNESEESQAIYVKESIIVTSIPSNTNLINTFTKTNANSENEELKGFISNKVIVTKQTNLLDTVVLKWNPYFLNTSNKIVVDYYFDDLMVFENKVIDTIEISASGKHSFRFKDLAGNVHMFKQSIYSAEKFDLFFIKSAIWTIDNKPVIKNAIFDHSIVVSVPESTLQFYDASTPPVLHAKRNGVDYEIAQSSIRSWTFKESGFYEVWFSAKWLGEDIREEKTSFSIINPKETRWGFEYGQFEKYEILSVVRGNEDITDSLKTDLNLPLRSIYVSIDDEKTGSGRYFVTIKAVLNDEMLPVQKFSFEFWINEGVAPIIVSVPHGTESIDKITVSFNVLNMFKDLGDCYVKISGFEPYVINKAVVDAIGEGEEVKVIEITKQDNYLIQVFTDNGNLVYSYRVSKKDPLNTISIVLIVASVLLAAGIIIVFVKLRKKVKIR